MDDITNNAVERKVGRTGSNSHSVGVRIRVVKFELLIACMKYRKVYTSFARENWNSN